MVARSDALLEGNYKRILGVTTGHFFTAISKGNVHKVLFNEEFYSQPSVECSGASTFYFLKTSLCLRIEMCFISRIKFRVLLRSGEREVSEKQLWEQVTFLENL